MRDQYDGRTITIVCGGSLHSQPLKDSSQVPWAHTANSSEHMIKVYKCLLGREKVEEATSGSFELHDINEVDWEKIQNPTSWYKNVSKVYHQAAAN
jgi:hypothetical protein